MRVSSPLTVAGQRRTLTGLPDYPLKQRLEPLIGAPEVLNCDGRVQKKNMMSSASLMYIRGNCSAFHLLHENSIVFWYLLSGYRICCVVKGSKYGKYAFAPSALHLQHPLSRYVPRKNCCVKSDFPLWEFLFHGYAVNPNNRSNYIKVRTQHA